MPQTLGAERAMVLRCTNWGMQVGRFLTSILTPLIASNWGWRAAPVVYAVFTAAITLPWEAWASDTPGTWKGWPRMGAAERALLTETEPIGDDTTQPNPNDKARPIPWRLLVSKPAIAPILMHTADNMGTYTFSYWTPTYFQQVFKASPTTTGAYLASTHLFSVAGGFVAPLLEVAILNAGLDPLKVVRRRCRHSLHNICNDKCSIARIDVWLRLFSVANIATAAATFGGSSGFDNAGCLFVCVRVRERSSFWSRVQRYVQLFQ